MCRAPDRKRSSRSRACPSPTRCPTRRPPRSTARRPPAGPTGARPTARNTIRAAAKQPLLGRSAVADTTSSRTASYRDLALAGVAQTIPPSDRQDRGFMILRLLYLIFVRPLGWLVLLGRRAREAWPDYSRGRDRPCGRPPAQI